MRGCAGEHIVDKEDTHLIARRVIIGSLMKYGTGYTVRVRVGSYDDIRLQPRSMGHGGSEGLLEFGVWLWAGRKGAVRVFLFGHDTQVLQAKSPQNGRYRDKPRSVEGRV